MINILMTIYDQRVEHSHFAVDNSLGSAFRKYRAGFLNIKTNYLVVVHRWEELVLPWRTALCWRFICVLGDRFGGRVYWQRTGLFFVPCWNCFCKHSSPEGPELSCYLLMLNVYQSGIEEVLRKYSHCRYPHLKQLSIDAHCISYSTYIYLSVIEKRRRHTFYPQPKRKWSSSTSKRPQVAVHCSWFRIPHMPIS